VLDQLDLSYETVYAAGQRTADSWESTVNDCRRPSLIRARWNLERLLCALSRRATIRR
jgi:hypothetical protein